MADPTTPIATDYIHTNFKAEADGSAVIEIHRYGARLAVVTVPEAIALVEKLGRTLDVLRAQLPMAFYEAPPDTPRQ